MNIKKLKQANRKHRHEVKRRRKTYAEKANTFRDPRHSRLQMARRNAVKKLINEEYDKDS